MPTTEIASEAPIDNSKEETFKATPATIKSDDSSLEITSPISLDLSSDSDRSIERVYNLKTGKVFAKVGSKLFNLNSVKKIDENHNTAEDAKLVPGLIRKFMEAEAMIEPPEQFRNDSKEMESLSVTMDFSLESEKEMTRPSSSIGVHTEILDLKDKQLVKNRLGEFSRSHPNLSTISQNDTSRKEFELERYDRRPSVNDLRKLFDRKSVRIRFPFYG